MVQVSNAETRINYANASAKCVLEILRLASQTQQSGECLALFHKHCGRNEDFLYSRRTFSPVAAPIDYST
jgi:hypothetical protein